MQAYHLDCARAEYRRAAVLSALLLAVVHSTLADQPTATPTATPVSQKNDVPASASIIEKPIRLPGIIDGQDVTLLVAPSDRDLFLFPVFAIKSARLSVVAGVPQPLAVNSDKTSFEY